MAIINKSGIDQGLVISSEHITRIIDSLNGTGLYTVSTTGSFLGEFSGSVTATPLLLVRGEAQIAPTGSVTTEASHFNFRNKGQNYISHATTAGFTLFRNDSSNMMIITGSYIGIGTDDPKSMFHINATGMPSTGEQLMRFTVSDDTSANLIISNGTGTNGVFSPTISGKNSSAGDAPQLSLNAESGTDSGTFPAMRFSARSASNEELLTKPLFAWYNYGTERMRMTAAGNVGINTTSPASLLHVNGVLTVGSTSNYTSSLSLANLTYINSQFHPTTGGSIMQFRGHSGVASNVLLMSLTGSTGDLYMHSGSVRAENFHYLDLQARPSSASYITPVREYTAPISAVSSSNWRPICVVRGSAVGHYASAANGITLRLSGTTGSAVVNVSAEIITNHRGDVFIKSIAGDYTQVKLKVEAGRWNNFNVYAKAFVGSALPSSVDLEAYVIPHFRNEIVFASTSTSTGSFITQAGEYINSLYDWTVVEHHCSPGLAISNTDSDIYSGAPSPRMSNITTIGSVFIGATPTGSENPVAKLHVVNNLDETPSLLVQDSAPDSSPFVIDKDGSVGIGTIYPSASLHVQTPAAGAESIARFGISDDMDSYFEFVNGTGTVGAMLPTLYGHSKGSQIASYFVATSDNDTGTAPIMGFMAHSGSVGTFTDIQNRPLFEWRSKQYKFMQMTPSGYLGIGQEISTIPAHLTVKGEVLFAETGSTTALNTHFNYQHKGQNIISHGTGSGYTLFRTSTNNGQTVMYLTGSYVSIGTAYDPIESKTAPFLTDNSSPLMVSNSIDLRTTSNTASLFLKSGDGTVRHYISGYCSTGVGNEHLYIGSRYGDIHFQVQGQNPVLAGTRLFVSASGNVGIGTTAPSAKLNVVGSAVGTTLSDWKPSAQFENTTPNVNKLIIGTVRTTNGGTDHTTTGTRIQQQIDSTYQAYIQFGGSNAQSGIEFGVGAGTPGGSIPISQPAAMTIDSIGRVGIGKLPTSTLDVNGTVNGTGFSTTSDIRLKENIEEADYETCYNIINSLPLKRYSWRQEVFDSMRDAIDRNKIGWIAQDVETVFPHAIHTGSFFGSGSFTSGSYDGFYIEDAKYVNFDQIYAAMYGTIKYLIAENNELKTQVSASNADIAAIKSHLGL